MWFLFFKKENLLPIFHHMHKLISVHRRLQGLAKNEIKIFFLWNFHYIKYAMGGLLLINHHVWSTQTHTLSIIKMFLSFLSFYYTRFHRGEKCFVCQRCQIERYYVVKVNTCCASIWFSFRIFLSCFFWHKSLAQILCVFANKKTTKCCFYNHNVM